MLYVRAYNSRLSTWSHFQLSRKENSRGIFIKTWYYISRMNIRSNGVFKEIQDNTKEHFPWTLSEKRACRAAQEQIMSLFFFISIFMITHLNKYKPCKKFSSDLRKQSKNEFSYWSLHVFWEMLLQKTIVARRSSTRIILRISSDLKQR